GGSERGVRAFALPEDGPNHSSAEAERVPRFAFRYFSDTEAGRAAECGRSAAEVAAMLGAIAGDVIGSVHEGVRTKTKDFPLFTPDSRFTDDTVLSVAVAECLLRGRDYVDAFHDYFDAYPTAGYGGSFLWWASSRRREPYQNWGNGSAMRVSPVAYACATLEE